MSSSSTYSTKISDSSQLKKRSSASTTVSGIEVFVINQIAKSENLTHEQLGYIFRTIYGGSSSGSEGQTGTTSSTSAMPNRPLSLSMDLLMKRLEHEIVVKEQELMELCESDHPVLLAGLDSFLNLTDLMKSVEQQLNDLKLWLSQVKVEQEELKISKTIATNIKSTIDAFDNCGLMLHYIQSIQTELKVTDRAIDYSNILRLLNRLEFDYLSKMPEYDLVILTRKWSAEVKALVEKHINSELEGWFRSLDKDSTGIHRRLGKSAMVASLDDRQEAINVRLDLDLIHLLIHLSGKMNKKLDIIEKISFERLNQFKELCHRLTVLEPFSIQALEDLLYDIIGFFLMEATLQASPHRFYRSVQTQDKEDAWLSLEKQLSLWTLRQLDMMESIGDEIPKDKMNVSNKNQFIEKLTEYLSIFSITLSCMDLPTDNLEESVSNLFFRAIELERHSVTNELLEICRKDTLSPIEIENEYDLRALEAQLPFLQDLKLTGSSPRRAFPLKLQCSSVVISCVQILKAFLSKYFKDPLLLREDSSEFFDYVKKILENFLVETLLPELMKEKEKKPSKKEAEIMLTNLEYLKQSFDDIHKFVTNNLMIPIQPFSIENAMQTAISNQQKIVKKF